jgi:beta-glucosidase-like glycosyl hydrolase
VPVAAAEAGVDILLFAKTGDAEPARQALRDALRRGELSRPDVERSYLRILALKESM